MTTLAGAMLEVARLLCRVREGSATSGTTSTLVDTAMIETGGTYTDGTLWILSGDNNGLCAVVNNHVEQTLSIATQGSAIAANDSYVVADGKYQKHQLKQAILTKLREIEVIKKDTDQEAVEGDTETTITLDAGISNVRRVEIDGDISHYWKERDGVLYFHAHEPDESSDIVIWYMAPHGDIAESADIDDAVSLSWLKWAAVEDLLWKQYDLSDGDDPTAAKLLEKASALARRYESDKRSVRVMERDPIYSGW